jgi:beta-lactamase regulating signal transducer with metallopeptidase domain
MAWWLFQNVVVTAGLALVVALACRAGGRRLGPVARHALWLVVLIKFVTPPLVVWPWAAPDPLGVSALDGRQVARVAEAADTALVLESPSESVGDDLLLRVIAPVEAAAAGAQAGWTPSRLAALAWPWLLALWAAGSLALAALEAIRVARLIDRVRDDEPADAAVVARVAECAARLGMAPVPVVAVAGITSPAIWSFGRTRLLWPADLPAGLPDACLDGLVVHELAHVKRRDHLVGWIELVAGIVWWWNPLFWYVRSALREQAELACDAWVISALPNGRRAYAESLLALSGAGVRGEPSMALLGVRATSRRMLERRLVMIMQGRAPLRLPMVGLVSLALVAAATLPAWATAQDPPPPPPAPVVKPVPPAPAPPAPPAPPARVVGAVPSGQAQAGRAVVTPTAPTQAPAAPSAVRAPRPAVAGQVAPAPSPQGGFARPAVAGIGRSLATNLPADGQDLVKGFETQRDAIEKEADQKIAAGQEALMKALQDLQDKYAKAGKLDEAVAIRDYIRAGGPGRTMRLQVVRPSGASGWVIRR